MFNYYILNKILSTIKIEFNMTKNNILKIEIVLKEVGLTNLGIVVFL